MGDHRWRAPFKPVIEQKLLVDALTAHTAPRALQTEAAECFTLDDLLKILRTHRVDWPRLRFFSGGSAVPHENLGLYVDRRSGAPYWQPDQGALQAQMNTGLTIVLDRVDQLDDRVLAHCLQLEAMLDAPVFANAYASWGSVAGFGRHWDDHDVLAWQLNGTKQWELWAPTRTRPRFLDVEAPTEPDGEPDATVQLNSGDLLCVPAGWWHTVWPVNEPSLHITFGIERPTGVDLLKWLADTAVEHDQLRQPLDLTPDGEQSATMQALERWLSAQALGRALVEEYLDHLGATAPARPWLTPPVSNSQALPPSRAVYWLVPRARLHQGSDYLHLHADGQAIDLDTAAAPVLEHLKKQPVTTVDELQRVGTISDADLDTLLAELARLGIVGIDPDV
ncbi:MAG: cupin domain-containing protein [Actinomycetota bacterium]